MAKDDSIYLGHLLDMARKILERIEVREREDFDADEDFRLALAHLIQVIGEAAAHVSEEGRAAHPEIPWREVIGMRQKIVHDYMSVDEDVVWQVASQDIPDLTAKLEKIVEA